MSGWTTVTWRLLCLLAVMSALTAITGLLWQLPPVWHGVAVTPGLLVVPCVVVAGLQDSRPGSGK